MTDGQITLRSATHAPNEDTRTHALYNPTPATLQASSPARENASRDALRRALTDLSELQDMAPNWDSYGGDPPTTQAITSANLLLNTVQQVLGKYVGARIEPQYVAPRADGGIQVEWGSRPFKISVQVTASGDLGYLLVDWRSGVRTADERLGVARDRVLQAIAGVVFAS